MKKFDFYEFTGILAPGAVVVYGLARIYPELGILVHDEQVTFGEFGLLLILAYVAGHLSQSVGNLIECVWWKCACGWPSDWVRTRKHDILSVAQWNILPCRIRELLKIECSDDLNTVSVKDWKAITRQVYAVVRKAGCADRIDIFNGNYGMFRGVAASIFVVMAAAWIDLETHNWRLYGVLAVMLCLALLRMNRFCVHYTRELFIQFLNIAPNETAKADKKKED